MSLEDSQITVGGLQFKGVYIALLLTIVSTIGGTIWTASTLYSRLEGVEGQAIPDIKPLTERVSLVEQELIANDVSALQGKLAALGVNLETIIDQQQKLLLISEKVTALDKDVAGMATIVQRAEIVTERSLEMLAKVERLQTEVNELWQAMDYLSDPLGAN